MLRTNLLTFWAGDLLCRTSSEELANYTRRSKIISEQTHDWYDKKINIPSSILLSMEDIWNLSRSLNIYVCREANRTVDYLAKKGLGKFDSSVCCLLCFQKLL